MVIKRSTMKNSYKYEVQDISAFKTLHHQAKLKPFKVWAGPGLVPMKRGPKLYLI